MGLSLGGGLGPFRASVSTRGVRAGISTGVGPVRYNKTLISTRSRRGHSVGTTYSVYSHPVAAPTPRRPDYFAQLPNQLYSTTGAPMAGQTELTQLLNQAASYRSGAVLCSLPLYALAIATLIYVHPLVALLCLVAAVTVAILLYNRARPFRTINVSYALPTDGFATPEQISAVQRHLALTRQWPDLIRAQRVWRRVGHVRLDNPYHQKIGSGATSLSERDDVTAAFTRPRHLQLDEQVATPSLQAGAHSLFFLPDRVLTYDSGTHLYSEVSYANLRISVATTDYIEDRPTNQLPRDARRVDTTWLRVNKDGGPDRRYAQNYRIPVMRYDALTLLAHPAGGLRWELIISRPGTAQTIAKALI